MSSSILSGNSDDLSPPPGEEEEKSRAARGWFIPIHTAPGQNQPFTLAQGAAACPFQGCPQYGRVRKPHWRVNEHMKLRHGWPRKNSSSRHNTDIALAQWTDKYGSADSPKAQVTKRKRASESNNDDFDSSLVLPEDDSELRKSSRGRPLRTRRPTKRASLAFEEPSDHEDHSQLQTKTKPHTPKEPERITAISFTSQQVDVELHEIIKSCVARLRSSQESGNLATPEDPSKYDALAKDLDSLLLEERALVNSVLDSEQAKKLSTLYKRLSEHYNHTTAASANSTKDDALSPSHLHKVSTKSGAPSGNPAPWDDDGIAISTTISEPSTKSPRSGSSSVLSASASTPPSETSNSAIRPMRIKLLLSPRTKQAASQHTTGASPATKLRSA